jgi:hypothetical protein
MKVISSQHKSCITILSIHKISINIKYIFNEQDEGDRRQNFINNKTEVITPTNNDDHMYAKQQLAIRIDLQDFYRRH